MRDITDVVRRVFKLKDNLLILRNSFEHAKTDMRAIRDAEFREIWKRIARDGQGNKV